MAVVYRIKPALNQDVTFKVRVWTTDRDYVVTMTGTTKEVSDQVRELVTSPGFVGWEKVG